MLRGYFAQDTAEGCVDGINLNLAIHQMTQCMPHDFPHEQARLCSVQL